MWWELTIASIDCLLSR